MEVVDCYFDRQGLDVGYSTRRNWMDNPQALTRKDFRTEKMKECGWFSEDWYWMNPILVIETDT
jgi:hypothetical protein